MRAPAWLALLLLAGCAKLSGEAPPAVTQSAPHSLGRDEAKARPARTKTDPASGAIADLLAVEKKPSAPPPKPTAMPAPEPEPVDLTGDDLMADGLMADNPTPDAWPVAAPTPVTGRVVERRRRPAKPPGYYKGKDKISAKPRATAQIETTESLQVKAEEKNLDDEAADLPAFGDLTLGLDEDGNPLDLDDRRAQPRAFLPRRCYFENTYLGGNAAHEEHLRRLDEAFGEGQQPYRQAFAPPQSFDVPASAGIGLSASLDTRWLDQPQRVYLQIGLRGSERYGWRRPPLDVALVLDTPALQGQNETALQAILELLRQLGPRDHLGVILAGAQPQVLADLDSIRRVRGRLAQRLETLAPPPAGSSADLAAAMRLAGERLRKLADDRTRIPGSQTVLVISGGQDAARSNGATAAAHALSVQGAVTSLIELGRSGPSAWWQVANAGHGNYHRAEGRDPRPAIREELTSLARVVARLLRINIRLGKHTEAVRILGSHVLGQRAVRRVKAREEATDRNLSRTLGVKADRGDDDDGVQSVIPYFYGGDTHLILVELWVDRPGQIAEITLRYKDMVNLSNATARTSVSLRAAPRRDTALQAQVRRNVQGFHLADLLDDASRRAAGGDREGVRRLLRQARGIARPGDLPLIAGFERLVASAGSDQGLSEALGVARARRVGLVRR